MNNLIYHRTYCVCGNKLVKEENGFGYICKSCYRKFFPIETNPIDILNKWKREITDVINKI